MNILILSGHPWDDTHSVGNTYSNFFSAQEWRKDVFYNIYLRNIIPNNKICENYYSMSPINMFKNIFSRNRIGKRFTNIDIERMTESNNNDNNDYKYINLIHKYSIGFAYSLTNMIYRSKIWLNDNFKSFIEDAKPDVFFAIATNISILKPMIEYIKKNTNAKIVLYMTDDFYGSFNNKSYLSRLKLRNEFRQSINMADNLYGISKEICNEYENIFNRKFEILNKGCSLEYGVKEKINKPIKFVYAGNLLYGRDEILSLIVNAIKNNNENSSKKAFLEIYTGSTINDRLNNTLNIINVSKVMGRKDYEEIKKIMSNADYNLHVESFEKKQIETTKFSFSTKITDCIQSGSGFIGIGPDNIASIEYIKGIPGVHVINNVNDINLEISKIINSNDVLIDSKRIRHYAMKHDISKNSIRLRNDFINMLNKGD